MRSLATLAGAVFVVALIAFAIERSHSQIHPPLPEAKAIPAALGDPGVRAALSGSGWDHARTIALDRTHWRVTFFAGPRYVLDVAIDPRGKVAAAEVHRPGLHPAGSTILWSPALLALLAALFAAAVAVRPLADVRNLDAVVIAAGFTVSALLIDNRLVGAHVYLGAATLAYIVTRCLWTGLGASARRAAREPLLPEHRMVRVVTAAALVAALAIVITSTGISDVAFAGLAGGTLLNHGVSPYGHITTEVVHGDTYPLLTYVLYMPVAALAPVRDSFDSLDGSLWLNAVALVAAAALFARNGLTHVLAWLTFPPVLLAASGGGNDVPAAAFVVAALVVASRTQLSAALLALAGWVKIAPAAALVPWLARLRGGSLARALALVVALLVAGIGAMAIVGGSGAVHSAIDALRFQFERGSWFSVWRQAGLPALQVALQALTVTVAVVAGLVARREPELSLPRLAALGGAIVAMLQLSANYWTFAYLPWLLPFILVALFPPLPRRSPPPAPRAP